MAAATTNLLRLFQPCSTLLIASTRDAASVNLYSCLLQRPFWQERLSEQIFETTKGDGGKLYLWIQQNPLLNLDYPDRLFSTLLEKENDITDCLFLSKHFAASGKPSLTVHPIGIPWQIENSQSGGIPGRCSPPNFRIAALYRQLLATSKSLVTDQNTIKFEITMEATHHGPFCDKPTCFVEIGSSEDEWSREELGQIWVQTLETHFQLGAGEGAMKEMETVGGEGGVVVVMIGGGHYVPKMNDLARLGEGLFIGHALTSYALLPQLDSAHEAYIPGKWQLIIREAVDATRQTFGRMQIICLVDKKAFGAEARRQIEAFLDEEAIAWSYKSADVEALWKNRPSSN